MCILLFVISLALVVHENAAEEATRDVIKEGECPFLCACSGNTIKCANFTILPLDLPKETVEFYFANSTVSFIPINAFLDLPRLERISFTSVTIATVRACSFAELENLTEISFTDVRISVIEGNAFSNLNNISTLTFEDSSIHEMKSFSFHNVANVSSLRFLRTKISVIHPYSFLKFDSTELSIENSFVTRFLRNGLSQFSSSSILVIKSTEISMWQCGSLNTFSRDGNVTGVSVTELQIGCSCSLAWLWTKWPEAPVISEESNRCNVSGSRLSTLSVDQVCPDVASRDRGCPPLLPSVPHSCSRAFDSPHEAEEKVDYPKYFTRKPASGSATIYSNSLGLIQRWVVASFLITMHFF